MAVRKIITPPLPLTWEWLNPKEHLRKVSLVVNEMLAGKCNNTLAITLWPNEVSSEIEIEGITGDTVPVLVPTTASAAALQGSGTLFSTCSKGKLTVYHDSDPAEDRSFGVILVG